MSLKRFTSVKNLRGLGRPLLKEFFGKFEAELKECKSDATAGHAGKRRRLFQATRRRFFSPKEITAKK